MDPKTSSSTLPAASSTSPRRKRRSGGDAGVRYFLPKPGSSQATPELGQEVASEGEALIQAFRSGQPFYTLTAWKAVPEVNGGGSPVIVKQAVAPKLAQ
ncbi:MAG TPA: hypothetical protein VEV41_15700, partial [Terriglobales bacterium]|nr:hypothetical protein [Terriglobales bacterium]HYL14487.1 hypothetical protein [Terriglobales bacterium]